VLISESHSVCDMSAMKFSLVYLINAVRNSQDAGASDDNVIMLIINCTGRMIIYQLTGRMLIIN